MNQPPPLPIDGASSSEEEQDLDLQEIEFIPIDDEVPHDVVDVVANKAVLAANDDLIGFNSMDLVFGAIPVAVPLFGDPNTAPVFHWPQLVAHLEQQPDAQHVVQPVQPVEQPFHAQPVHAQPVEQPFHAQPFHAQPVEQPLQPVAAVGESFLPGEYPLEPENPGRIKFVMGLAAALVTGLAIGVFGTMLFRRWEKKEPKPWFRRFSWYILVFLPTF